jgi:branched-chain amino acid transport system permease protein
MALGLALAPLAAAAGALLFGFFIVRLTHTYFAMLSLAFAQIVFTVVFKWKALTGGDDGILDVWPPAVLKSPRAYCYFTFAVAGLAMLALRMIVDSPFGYALRAIRENPRRARFIGVNVRRHQLFAFVLSGFFSGLAGGLFAFLNGSVFPDYPVLFRPAGRRHRLQDPRDVHRAPVARVLAALPRPAVVFVVVALPQGFVGLLQRRMWRTPTAR